jgi:large subunit ribosomal protein L22
MTQLITATSKYLHVSPTKLNRICNLIRGKSYIETLKIFHKLSQKSVLVVWRTLLSAVSIALELYNYKKTDLRIAEIYVNKGAVNFGKKKVRFLSKGRQTFIEKKTSHLTVSLSKK